MPLSHFSHSAVALLVATLLLAACGGVADQGSPTAAGQAATMAPTATEAPTSEPTATTAPSPTAVPTASPVAEPTAGPDPNDALDVEVAAVDVTFVDPTRSTDETTTRDGDVRPAADSRTIEATVFHPVGGGEDSYPVILVAHGLGDQRFFYTDIGQSLSRRGYVVVVPDFPETSNSLSSPGDFVDQPADLSFVLDTLVATLPADIASLPDLERVGLMGHSLGAATVLGATSNSCCTDPRIDAVVASGAGTPFSFPNHEYTWGPTPKLIINGSDDPISPMELAREHFEASSEPVHLLTVRGAGHFDTLHEGTPWLEPLLTTTADFLDIHVAGRSTTPLESADDSVILESRR